MFFFGRGGLCALCCLFFSVPSAVCFFNRKERRGSAENAECLKIVFGYPMIIFSLCPLRFIFFSAPSAVYFFLCALCGLFFSVSSAVYFFLCALCGFFLCVLCGFFFSAPSAVYFFNRKDRRVPQDLFYLFFLMPYDIINPKLKSFANI